VLRGGNFTRPSTFATSFCEQRQSPALSLSLSLSLSLFLTSHYRGLCMPDVSCVKGPSVTSPFFSLRTYSTLLPCILFFQFLFNTIIFSFFPYSSFSSFYFYVFPSLFLDSFCHSLFSFVTHPPPNFFLISQTDIQGLQVFSG